MYVTFSNVYPYLLISIMYTPSQCANMLNPPLMILSRGEGGESEGERGGGEGGKEKRERGSDGDGGNDGDGDACHLPRVWSRLDRSLG
jgi:hypothetical protein